VLILHYLLLSLGTGILQICKVILYNEEFFFLLDPDPDVEDCIRNLKITPVLL
jgi:hypothetical protein